MTFRNASRWRNTPPLEVFGCRHPAFFPMMTFRGFAGASAVSIGAAEALLDCLDIETDKYAVLLIHVRLVCLGEVVEILVNRLAPIVGVDRSKAGSQTNLL